MVFVSNSDNLYAAIAVIAILAFAVTMIVGAVAYRNAFSPSQTNSALQKSTVTVTATGSVSAVPSQSTIYITANGTASNAANATARLARTVYAINSTLSSYLASGGSSIQTVSYQLYRPYNSSVYTASEGIVVTISINSTGSALAALSSVSDAYITGVTIQLSPSQVSSLSGTALSIAMQNATAQAQQVAGTHVPLTISSVSINSNGYIYPSPKLALGANIVPVFAGTQSVTQSVTVVFTYA